MDRSSALSTLATLTSGLKPIGTSTAADLDAARSALARSLLVHALDPATAATGLPTPPTASPSAEDLSALNHILDTAAAAASGPVPLVFPRSVPALPLGNPALTPAPVAGMLPQSIGPFVDVLGALHWFDIFPPVQLTAISRTPSTVPFLLLPIALPAGPVPMTLPVAAGTLWIEAQLLASASPAGGYAGIAISGGTLDFSSVATAIAAGLQVAAATELTLTVTLAAQAGPTGGGDPGADGGAAVANMPPQVTFVFTQTGAQITAAGDASLTAYGSTIGLQFESVAPVYEPSVGQILVAFKPNTTRFPALSVLSNLFQLTGTAKVDIAAWAIPVAVTAPAQLGAAASPGLLALVLGAGLKANWPGTSGGSTALSLVILEVSAGFLGLIARIQSLSQFSMQIGLWPATPTSAARSSIDASFPTGALLYYESVGSFAGVNHVEILNCVGSLNSHIDRPVAADGSRLGSIMGGAMTVYETSSNNGVIVAGVAPAGTAQEPPIAVALENALLMTTPPLLLFAAGTFGATPVELDQGGLLLAFGLFSVLPTLPDPYAANFLPVVVQQPELGQSGAAVQEVAPTSALLATVLWSPTSAAVLSFSDSTPVLASLRVGELSPSPAPVPVGSAGAQDQSRRNALLGLVNAAVGSPTPDLYLLDVSSNVDQFGVGMAITSARDAATYIDAETNIAVTTGTSPSDQMLSIAGLDLIAPVRDLRVFTVPSIQWEPVVTIQNPKVLPYPFPSPAGFLDDGGPTLFGAADVTLVPVAPAPLLNQLVSAYDRGKAAAALLTLPFGMTAAVLVPQRAKSSPPINRRRPGFREVQPDFTPQNMFGGRQVSLTVPPSLGLTNPTPSLPGATIQLRNLVDENGNPMLDSRPPTPSGPGGLQLSVLGFDVDTPFNEEFAPGASGALVPVSRIDVSGYGASAFSAWTDPTATPPAVVQARFNVIVGRTSHEVVQVESPLYGIGAGAKLVRTITIERQDDGTVNRHDRGWKAVTPGLFEVPGMTMHPGAVIGAYNIREISDTSQTYTSSGGVELVGVYFDADLKIAGVASGANAEGLVPSTGLFGFVQIGPVGVSLTPTELAGLIKKEGPLGGPVNCVIAIGGTAQTMRLSRVELGNAPHAGATPTDEFAATARGSVVLPQPGSWSIVQRTDTVSEPTPLDPDLGVSLIRQGPAGGPTPTTPWRLAEPVDLWSTDSPSMDYCLQHSTDSTRMLFPRPWIASGATAFTSDQTPLLADGFALLVATSVFPRQDSCLTFPNANYSLQIDGSGAFTLAGVPASFAPSIPNRTLATASAGTIAFEYADNNGTPAQISTTISPSSWTVGLRGINVRVDIGPFNGLLRTVGNVQASSSGGGVAFNNGQLVLGSVLQPVQDLLSFLGKLGLPNPLTLAFSNSGWTQSKSYKLDAGLLFTVPSIYLPALWIFLKQPTDSPPGVMPFSASLTIKTGFGNSVSGPAATAGALLTNSSQWSAYLSISGTFQWEVWPPVPLKVGFLLGFSVQINFPVGATAQSTQLVLQLGGVISIGGSLGPVLSVSASISLVFSFVVTISAPSSITIGVGLILSANGKVLQGLVGITFTAEAAGAVTVTSPQSVQATFSVSVDVQLCWVLDVSFSFSEQFKHQLSA
jgi:hypothetical protein